ncbi:MAG: hypothetical protein JWO38_3420 [Gemmataceae bacterium]|nr:hypothetical protein [Gemmataceae bacterium]
MRTILFTLAAILTLGLAGPAPARDANKPGTAEPAKQALKKLTVEELGELLDAMGYNPKPVKNKDGKVNGYSTEFPSGTWTIRIDFLVTADGSQVVLDSGLFTFTDQSQLPAEAILGTLSDNFEIFPASVYYINQTKRLRMAMTVQSSNLTPASLRVQVDFYVAAVKRCMTNFNQAVDQATATKEQVKKPGPGGNPIP